MRNKRYTPKFKDDVARQVVERGNRVSKVAERLGVSTRSLHKWFDVVERSKTDQQAAELDDAKTEILKPRAELWRVQKEHDIRKKDAVLREPAQRSTASLLIAAIDSLCARCVDCLGPRQAATMLIVSTSNRTKPSTLPSKSEKYVTTL